MYSTMFMNLTFLIVQGRIEHLRAGNYAGLHPGDQIETQNIIGLVEQLAEDNRLLSRL